VRTERNVWLSMMACGALAGIAGAFQIISPVSQGRLYPDVSGGLGFLSLLVVLLVNIQPVWVPFISLFFGIVPVGILKLQISAGIDPSLGRVFQSVLVLIVILANGIRTRLRRSPGDS
jgi:simple sugar transport system permease protein